MTSARAAQLDPPTLAARASARRLPARASRFTDDAAHWILGIVAAVVVLVPRGAAGEPCPARADLEGDRAAVARVTGELKQLGVETGAPSPGCRALRARVELDRDGGLDIAIVDGSRRSEGRVVANEAVAAAWIDSWLREDFDGIGLAPPAGAQVAAAPARSAARRVAARADAPPGMHDDGVAAASPSVFESFAIAGGYEQSWSDDGAGASGFSASACLRVGRACIGARLRYANEGERTVESTAMSRTDLAVLATATVAFGVGRMLLAPELGIGVGRRTTRRVERCPIPPPKCDPNTPNCDPGSGTVPDPNDPACTDPSNAKFFVGDNLDATTYTPRAAAAIRLAVPLFDHVWLDGLASITIAPFGHGDYTPGKTPQPLQAPVDQVTIPRDPFAGFQLGVGLRIGAP